MSQASELLNNLENQRIAASLGPEPHIVVGADRFITVPSVLKRLAVQGDHNIETVTFDCPRYWDDLDLYSMNVFVNYLRSDGVLGSFEAENKNIDESDANLFHFTWTISGNVTKVPGKLRFIVCAKVTDESGEDVHHWHSELNDETYISEGLDCGDSIVDMLEPDVIMQILTRLDGLETQDTPDADWVATKTEAGGETVVIAEQTLTGGMWSKLQVDIQLGIPYEVYINGTRYPCIAYEEDGGIYLGNPTLFYNVSTKPHNNEPFCIFWAGGNETAGFFYKDSTLNYPLTLKVTDEIVTVYNKLPEGYLPDGVAMLDDIPQGGGVSSWNDLTDKPFGEETVEADLLTEQAVGIAENQGALPFGLDLFVGETYTVTWDGVTYSCVCGEYVEHDEDTGEEISIPTLGNASFLGGEETTEPFLLAALPTTADEPATMIVAIEDGIHTISISGLTKKVNTLPNRYLDRTFLDGVVDEKVAPMGEKVERLGSRVGYIRGYDLSSDTAEISWDKKIRVPSGYLTKIFESLREGWDTFVVFNSPDPVYSSSVGDLHMCCVQLFASYPFSMPTHSHSWPVTTFSEISGGTNRNYACGIFVGENFVGMVRLVHDHPNDMHDIVLHKLYSITSD